MPSGSRLFCSLPPTLLLVAWFRNGRRNVIVLLLEPSLAVGLLLCGLAWAVRLLLLELAGLALALWFAGGPAPARPGSDGAPSRMKM